MQTISREEVKEKLRSDAAVIDVLAPETFRKFHLPHAVNVPVDDQFDEKIQQAVPDKSKPVVVYCYDQECTASPKAAERMEQLGYEHVFDYEAGKIDWQAAGLPVEK